MNIYNGVTHLAFADEAYRDQGRFRSVACVSMPRGLYTHNTNSILDARTISSELKWLKINGGRRLQDAELVFSNIVELAIHQQIRVDVLIWDTEDSRHKIQHRDDIDNLQKMYRFLFRDVVGKRWGRSIKGWLVYVDEQGLRSPDILEDDLRKSHQVALKEIHSTDWIFVQVADLFAGIEVFSHLKFDEYKVWQLQPKQSGQHFLPGFPFPKDNSSGVDSYRFRLLQYANDLFKENRMYVSLESYNGFRSIRHMNEQCTINFWQYTPQGDGNHGFGDLNPGSNSAKSPTLYLICLAAWQPWMR